MGTLKVGTLDFNEIGTFEALRTAIAEMASRAGFITMLFDSRAQTTSQ